MRELHSSEGVEHLEGPRLSTIVFCENPHFSRKERARNGAPGGRLCIQSLSILF